MAQDFLKIAKAMEMSPLSILFKIELNISNIRKRKDYLCLFTLTTGQMPIEMDKPDGLWSMNKQDSDF